MYYAELTELGIDLKGRMHGQIKTLCPKCSFSRKKSKEDCLSVNVDDGVYNCKNCGWKGSAIARKYATPPPTNQLGGDSESIYAAFAERKINRETVDHFGVTHAAVDFPERNEKGETVWKKKRTVCFNYFLSGQVINIKYKTRDKKFRMVTDALKVPYNIDAIGTHDYVIFVEGEEEAMVWHQCGYPSVVSCPNGASPGNNDLSWLNPVYDKFEGKKIYLATDEDDPGKKLAEDLSRRFPIENVFSITYPCKDANDTLKEYGDIFEQLFSEAQPVPIKEISEVKDYTSRILSYHTDGFPVGDKVDIPIIDEHMSWALGELITGTGVPSHGKSTFFQYMFVRLAHLRNWRIGMFTPEHDPALAISRIVEQYIGKAMSAMNTEELQKGLGFANEHFFFYNIDEIDDFKLTHLLEIAKMMIMRYGINAIMIDPYTYVENDSDGESTTDRIGKMLVRMKTFAIKNQILINLIAHPKKMDRASVQSQNYVVPKMYDISGSNNFYNTSDGGVIVYREFDSGITRVIFEKIKLHFRGKRGDAHLKFDVGSGTYYQEGTQNTAVYKLLKPNDLLL